MGQYMLVLNELPSQHDTTSWNDYHTAVSTQPQCWELMCDMEDAGIAFITNSQSAEAGV